MEILQKEIEVTPNSLYTEEVRSQEIQEIITTVPKWILRWGITVIFSILIAMIIFASFIRYPDIVRTSLKVNSLNAPKEVLARRNGKIVKLLVQDNTMVKENEILAYFESTAVPEDVLRLDSLLLGFSNKSVNIKTVDKLSNFPSNFRLGELQGDFEAFYEEYLQFRSTMANGYYTRQKKYLYQDINGVTRLKRQIVKQKTTLEQEYANATDEYRAYKILHDRKVISRSEFLQQENKFLAAKKPLQQNEIEMLNNGNSLNGKHKEILELNQTILEHQGRFIQAVNKCHNQIQAWIMQFVLRAPVSGRVSFAGIIQQGQNVVNNQEVFIINPGNTDFFGEIEIPQYNMGKIRTGERTLVKLKSYPYEQYGMIRGRLTYISDVALKDSVFIAKVSFDHFENKDPKRIVVLKNGMRAEAEIITEQSTLLDRFLRNIVGLMSQH